MTRASRPRVAVFVEYYLPGFRAGGPMRSISSLVEQLGDEIDFHVVTRDRDEGSDAPYPDCAPGAWVPVGKARVRYLSPSQLTMRHLVAAVREAQAQAVYLNSFFAPMSLRLLAARRFGALKGVPVILAPRGELTPGALRLKAFKKESFLRLAAWSGLHDDVVFHASTERERDEISNAIRLRTPPRIARNAVALTSARAGAPRTKAPGSARFVFLSRITRKKNLHLALEMLRDVEGSATFDIFGPVIDPAYWRECVAAIERMPPNVAVAYRGAIAHDEVAAALAGCHFFLLPTASENFGHAIVEALAAGCPLVTSDQTPWTALAQRGIGWDLPLDDRSAWRGALQACVDMDDPTYTTASLKAARFAETIASADIAAEHRRLFDSILDAAPAGGAGAGAKSPAVAAAGRMTS